MAGRGGFRPNAGRKAGIKNKATLEREQRALDALRGKAARLAPQTWAKDALEDMIPEADELTRSIKGVVARLQGMIFAQLDNPATAAAAATSEVMESLRVWTALLKESYLAASLIKYRAADFQSPKMQRIAVGIGVMGIGAGNVEVAPDNVHQINDPAAAGRVYLRLVEDGRAA
jgi:hypothetical protein